jgi:hypothetical protein
MELYEISKRKAPEVACCGSDVASKACKAVEEGKREIRAIHGGDDRVLFRLIVSLGRGRARACYVGFAGDTDFFLRVALQRLDCLERSHRPC